MCGQTRTGACVQRVPANHGLTCNNIHTYRSICMNSHALLPPLRTLWCVAPRPSWLQGLGFTPLDTVQVIRRCCIGLRPMCAASLLSISKLAQPMAARGMKTYACSP